MTELSSVDVSGVRWDRFLFSTPWVAHGDDLVAVLRAAARQCVDDAPERSVVVVTEKVVSLAAGLGVSADDIHVGDLARFLSRRIRPRGDSLALAVPEKMQWLIDEIGRTRIVLAAAASALTRPFGVAGVFYRVAGTQARDVDGVRGVYADTLIPPLPPEVASGWVNDLEQAFGVPVGIVDFNDRGGSIRALSDGLDSEAIAALMADNPLGRRDDSTPVAVFRCEEPLG